MNDTTIRIDNSRDWAEIQRGDKIIRRCHADYELIESLTELMVEAGATIEWTDVQGPRV